VSGIFQGHFFLSKGRGKVSQSILRDHAASLLIILSFSWHSKDSQQISSVSFPHASDLSFAACIEGRASVLQVCGISETVRIEASTKKRICG